MSDLLLIILVLAGGFGLIIGVAYLLNKRGRKSQGDPAISKSGPVGKILLWITRALVILMVLSIIGAIVFVSIKWIWSTAVFLLLYIIVGILRRIVLLSGK
jgi:hypothetical protein